MATNDAPEVPTAPDETAAAVPVDDAPEVLEAPVENRTAVAVAFPVIGSAVMVGGIFSGFSPRLYAVASGLLGIALALVLARLGRRTILVNLLAIIGLFGIGLVVLLPDFGAIVGVTREINEATAAGSIVRPPVDFLDGWKAIQGWLMGMIGFGAAWLALAVRWKSVALMLPLPVTAIAAISVPENAQVPSGLATLVLFAIGLGVIASEQAAGDDPDSRPSLAYELRKALKAFPLIAGITLALWALSTTSFLFPDPVYDPAEEPQRPQTQPLTEAPERVLFEVDSELDGPFRMGSLDVYLAEDGTWRLPPFAASVVVDIDKSGIVDKDLDQDLEATFTVRGLEGAVLPSLPNTAGVAASGPKLGFDTRNNNVRLMSGQAESGFTYKVTAAGLPTVEELLTIDFRNLPDGSDKGEPDIAQFTEMPEPPPAVTSLIGQAPTTSTWEKFDYLRNFILDNVTAKGTGRPVPVTMERIEDMIAGSREGSPFEIVAAQAMLARWVGVPSRIGYGFDGGERVEGKLLVRPTNGASFLEIYVPGHKWLPVIGTPRKAEPTVGADPDLQRLDPTIVPSNEVDAKLHLPMIVEPKSVLGKQIAVVVLAVVLAALFLFLLWTIYPAVRKAQLRSKRRTLARQEGVAARVALTYSEWRDYAADLGYHFPTETPLMFLERFIDDDEHAELAWLTTRVLWGDLRNSTDPEVASIAEELSRSLRRRLASVQPATLRVVASLSRISLRDPYAGRALQLPMAQPAPDSNGKGGGKVAAPALPSEEPRGPEALATTAPRGGTE